MADTPSVLGHPPPGLPPAVAQYLTRVAGFIDQPIADGAVSVGAEAANVRRFTLEVVNRLDRPRPGRWLVLVWLAETAYGAPGGTQTTSFNAGTVVEELAADQAWVVLTDADGAVELDVTVAGAATRHLHHLVLGPVPTPLSATWAA